MGTDLTDPNFLYRLSPQLDALAPQRSGSAARSGAGCRAPRERPWRLDERGLCRCTGRRVACGLLLPRSIQFRLQHDVYDGRLGLHVFRVVGRCGAVR